MTIIIRLQNLPLQANALDIRHFFQGLAIPDGGVHIVGGEKGDAFIAFSSDEDARCAMMLNGAKILNAPVSLYLSSKVEMQNIIISARAKAGRSSGSDVDITKSSPNTNRGYETMPQTHSESKTPAGRQNVSTSSRRTPEENYIGHIPERRAGDNDMQVDLTGYDQEENRYASPFRGDNISKADSRLADSKSPGEYFSSRNAGQRNSSSSNCSNKAADGRVSASAVKHERESKEVWDKGYKELDRGNKNTNEMSRRQWNHADNAPIKEVKNAVNTKQQRDKEPSSMKAPNDIPRGSLIPVISGRQFPRVDEKVTSNKTEPAPAENIRDGWGSLSRDTVVDPVKSDHQKMDEVYHTLLSKDIGSIRYDKDARTHLEMKRAVEVDCDSRNVVINRPSPERSLETRYSGDKSFQASYSKPREQILSESNISQDRYFSSRYSGVKGDASHSTEPVNKPIESEASQIVNEASQSFCVRIVNLPKTFNYREVRRTFVGCQIPKFGLKLVNDEHGFRTGRAYVEFETIRQRDIALMSNGKLVDGCKIVVSKCTQEEYQKIIDNYPKMVFKSRVFDNCNPKPESTVTVKPVVAVEEDKTSSRTEIEPVKAPEFIERYFIVIKRLPHGLSMSELRMLLGDIKIADFGGPYFESTNGVKTGNALAELSSHIDLKKAYTLHKTKFKDSVISIIPVKEDEYQRRVAISGEEIRCRNQHSEAVKRKQTSSEKYLQESVPSDNEEPKRIRLDEQQKNIQSERINCAFLRGLPYSATIDSVAEFFSGIQVLEHGIHLETNASSLAMGRAYVEFTNSRELDEAVARNGQHMGKRFIEVTPCSREKMISGLRTFVRQRQEQKQENQVIENRRHNERKPDDKQLDAIRFDDHKELDVPRLVVPKETDVRRFDVHKELDVKRFDDRKALDFRRFDDYNDLDVRRLNDHKEPDVRKFDVQKELDVRRFGDRKETDIRRLDDRKELDVRRFDDQKQLNVRGFDERNELDVRKFDDQKQLNVRGFDDRKDVDVRRFDDQKQLNVRGFDDRKELDVRRFDDQRQLNVRGFDERKELDVRRFDVHKELDVRRFGDRKETDIRRLDDRKELDVRRFDDQKQLNVRGFVDRKELDVRRFDEQKQLNVRGFDDRKELDVRRFDDQKQLNVRGFDDRRELDVRRFDDRKELNARGFDDRKELDVRQFNDRKELDVRRFDDHSLQRGFYRVHLSNLHIDTQLEDILGFLGSRHPIDGSVKMRYRNGQPTGEGHVAFETREEADSAIFELNDRRLLGRVVVLRPWMEED